MDLSRVIAISGKPGLYRLISQTRGGFVVEDLEKGKKISIASNYNVSLLDNVAIYGVSQEFPLAEVFFRIYKKETTTNLLEQNCVNIWKKFYQNMTIQEFTILI